MQDKVVAEAVRVEYIESTGQLFIVFEIKDEKYKQDIKKNWTKDIEYRIVDKNLVENEG
jgi:hypothetical protein